jgi:iron complex outermembrane receptor protein
MTPRFRRIILSAAFTSLALPVAGFGQQLEEITVTAQKREENIQDVPIAITAQTAEMLDRVNIENTDDLSIAVPGMQITRQLNALNTFIRGVGTINGAAGSEPSVPVYVDGVYNPFINTNIMEFNNIDRIEVLKGPQGTLFGRNATGGIIHVLTRDPSADPALRVKVGYGNFATTDVRLYGTAGLGESIAADLALVYGNREDGFIDNLTLNSEVGDYENLQLRSKWLFTPGDDTEIRLTGFWGSDDGSYGMGRSFLPGATGADGITQNTGDWYAIEHEFDPSYEHDSYGGSLQIDHSFGSVDLVSISAYAQLDGFFHIDQDGTPARIVEASISLEDEVFTQELRLQSSWDRSWDWILGAYYMDFTAKYTPLRLDGTIAPVTPIDIFSTGTTESLAFFADVQFQLTDAFRLTVGARQTNDDLEQKGETLFLGGVSLVGPYQQKTDFDEPTYRVSLDYRLSDAAMIYGSVSRGYKAGIYNLVVTGGVPAGALPPEIVDAYEIGYKGDLANDRFRLDAAFFIADYQDLQLTTLVPGSVVTVNAPSADTMGAEIEGIWVASDALELRFGLSWFDGEYNDFPNAPINPPATVPPGGNRAVNGQAKGNKLMRSPDFTANLIGVYRMPLEGGASLDLSGIVEYNDGYYWEPGNRLRQPSYTTVNAQAAWTSRDGRYRVSIWGKNLTDEEISNYSTASGFGDLYSPGEPITYGIAFEFMTE